MTAPGQADDSGGTKELALYCTYLLIAVFTGNRTKTLTRKNLHKSALDRQHLPLGQEAFLRIEDNVNMYRIGPVKNYCQVRSALVDESKSTIKWDQVDRLLSLNTR